MFKLLKSLLERYFPKSVISPKERGVAGEKLACSLLRKKGYSIEACGWRWHRYELDIIASKNNLLVFVEVKTRKSGDFGHPEQAVNSKKKRHIIKASRAYVKKNRKEKKLLRFDIVSIILTEDGGKEIKHIENAFHARF